MNRNHRILFNVSLFVLAGFWCHAQETSKTYKETFNVGNDAILNINTSHADIEFETWDRNQVEVTAVVELENATDEEAVVFFEKDPIKIVGNSKEIEVRTVGGGMTMHAPYGFNIGDLDIVIPDIPSVEHLLEGIELPEVMVIPEMPPMPPIPFLEFDYNAYKKDGDKYLKEWKEDFDENFDEEYQEHIKEWSKEVEKMSKEREEEIKQLREERERIREEARKVRDEARKQRDELRKQRDGLRHQARIERSVRIHSDGNSNVFYFSSDGESKKYKVKIHIKINMPKSVKLKMDVRHGEVKLADNTRNINASLSYASLLATTIDGSGTNIRASYSPVLVQKWNYGQLKTDYSDEVNLKEVKELKLNAISSNVTIDRILDNVLVSNNLGSLRINSVDDRFSSIDISVEHGEVDLKLPSVPFSIYVNETLSEFKYPTTLTLNSSKNHNNRVYRGYYKSKKNSQSINITSRYGDVVLKE
ncbi:hypothetical protein GTQ34_00580 [Muricauda sp. JGD-17]|uniref:Adhesin domain-containing protein n=1 Tax=Flagellimonas ochracea TaxID=2696472 RepID=A0A964WVW9_9FLAO|nr:DUF4097 family beta strand repeat-containing protein [Allomuricauda ochracea]NAY90401.1 hypothetical protein [Allomuricauda ochracea]